MNYANYLVITKPREGGGRRNLGIGWWELVSESSVFKLTIRVYSPFTFETTALETMVENNLSSFVEWQ